MISTGWGCLSVAQYSFVGKLNKVESLYDMYFHRYAYEEQ